MTDEGQMVNLAHVAQARGFARDKRDHYFLKDKDGESLGTVDAAQFDHCIEQIVVPGEPYDVLQIWFDGDEHFVTTADLVAWALCLDGAIYPISADDISPKTEKYALRRRGQERVELPMDATFDNEAAWIAEELKRKKREEERKAAAK